MCTDFFRIFQFSKVPGGFRVANHEYDYDIRFSIWAHLGPFRPSKISEKIKNMFYGVFGVADHEFHIIFEKFWTLRPPRFKIFNIFFDFFQNFFIFFIFKEKKNVKFCHFSRLRRKIPSTKFVSIPRAIIHAILCV